MSVRKDFTFARMKIEHLAGVLDIENLSFKDPWTEDAWRAELAYPEAICYVAMHIPGHVSAFLALRRTLDEGHIMRLAVHPAYRKHGLASYLIRIGLKALKNAACTKVFLELRQSNTIAASFYMKMGFEVIGKRTGYYRTPSEDAVVMCQKL